MQLNQLKPGQKLKLKLSPYTKVVTIIKILASAKSGYVWLLCEWTTEEGILWFGRHLMKADIDVTDVNSKAEVV